jgi:hypothetical protein
MTRPVWWDREFLASCLFVLPWWVALSIWHVVHQDELWQVSCAGTLATGVILFGAIVRDAFRRQRMNKLLADLEDMRRQWYALLGEHAPRREREQLARHQLN